VVSAKQALECHKIDEERKEGDEPRQVHVPETEGERAVEGPKINLDYAKPLRTRKVNIGT